jgi:hypothetical protein
VLLNPLCEGRRIHDVARDRDVQATRVGRRERAPHEQVREPALDSRESRLKGEGALIRAVGSNARLVERVELSEVFGAPEVDCCPHRWDNVRPVEANIRTELRRTEERGYALHLALEFESELFDVDRRARAIELVVERFEHDLRVGRQRRIVFRNQVNQRPEPIPTRSGVHGLRPQAIA